MSDEISSLRERIINLETAARRLADENISLAADRERLRAALVDIRDECIVQGMSPALFAQKVLRSAMTEGPKTVNCWDLIQDQAVKQLVFAFERVLSMMRTHARANQTMAEWVRYLDAERDEFVHRSAVGTADLPEGEFEASWRNKP